MPRLKRYVALFYTSLLVVWIALSYSIFWQSEKSYKSLVVNTTGAAIQVADFVHFYEAGQLAANDATRFHVYEPGVQTSWMQNFLKPAETKQLFYLQYVPFLFPLMIPLSLLKPEIAFGVWIAASAAAIFLAVLSVCKQQGSSPLITAAFLVGTFAAVPTWTSLVIGQLSGFLVLAIALYFYGMSKRLDVLSGCMLALSAAKPHYAIFAAIPALVQKRVKVIVCAAIAETALIVLAGTSIGWKNIIDYPSILSRSETSTEFAGLNPHLEVCIRGLLSTFFPQAIAFPASIVAWLIGVVAITWCWRKVPSAEVQLKPWAIALTVIGCLFLSPHTHLYDWTFLIIAAIVTLKLNIKAESQQETPSQRQLQLTFSVWRWMLWTYPALSWFILQTSNATHNQSTAFLLFTLLHCVLFALSANAFRLSAVPLSRH